jgi:hypothetical protein
MKGFFTTIWNGLVWAAGLLLPLGKHAGAAARSPAARWALHLLAVAAVLVLLYWLNGVLRIYEMITGSFYFLRHVWLPVLFLLVYLLAWLGWWLWQLLNAEEEASYYPDIDRAWESAVRTLGQNNIQVTDLPLFLVLGRPEGPEGPDFAEKARRAEEALFHQAAQLPLAVRQVPADAQAPLHVYATRDAIYVTCAGASLLGRQAAILAGEVETAAAGAVGGGAGGEEDPLNKTLGQEAPQVRKIVGIVREIARKGGDASEEERRLLRRLERRDRPQASLLRDTAAVADLSARLRHLCRLLARDREPYCPLNGLLVLVPLAATDSDDDAQNTAECLARDLQTLRGVLKVDCPQFALLCDMEMLPGFREFIGQQKAQDRQRRVGQRFPMGANLRGEPLAEAVVGAVEWMCLNTLRDWVYRLFRVEAPGREEAAAAVTANGRLYLMLGELREREGRLARVLTRGLVTGSDGAPRFGGCYLAGTGADSAQQAFVPGVFRRLTEAQNDVAWTPQARAEDARYQRLAGLGYTILAGLGVVVLAAAGWSLFGRSGRS